MEKASFSETGTPQPPCHPHPSRSCNLSSSQVLPESWQIPGFLTSSLSVNCVLTPNNTSRILCEPLPWPSRTVYSGNLALHPRVLSAMEETSAGPQGSGYPSSGPTLLPTDAQVVQHIAGPQASQFPPLKTEISLPSGTVM